MKHTGRCQKWLQRRGLASPSSISATSSSRSAAMRLGEARPLSQGARAGRQALKIRDVNGVEVRKKGPRGSSEPPEPPDLFLPAARLRVCVFMKAPAGRPRPANFISRTCTAGAASARGTVAAQGESAARVA